MGTIPLDYSFEREGLGLADWLWRLVDPDPHQRLAAGEALQAMLQGMPSIHINWGELVAIPDVPAQQSRFEEALHQTLAQPDFDTPQFVRKLVAVRLAQATDWLQRVDREMARTNQRDEHFERIAERLMKTITVSGTEAAKQHAMEQFIRLCAVYIAGSCCPKDNPLAGAESMSLAGHLVFTMLGTELLTAPEALEVMLQHEKERWTALAALARIGPPAVAFAPSLMKQLDALGAGASHDSSGYALGSIGRGNPEIVAEVIRRLESPSPPVRQAAVQALEQMGTDVCGHEELIAQRLAGLLDSEEVGHFAMRALASVGRHLPWVRERILERARPRPPQWKTDPNFPDYQFDHVMWERGTALSAMRYLTDYPNACVPVLIEATASFEEYDPDLCYDGPLGRISAVLCNFGPQAAAAAAPLVAHLRDEGEDFPKAILYALAAMGRAAQRVLPELYAFRQESSDPELLDDLETTEADEFSDQVGWAIQRILGR